jgi:tetratricopeptide (TPR) repeat protein
VRDLVKASFKAEGVGKVLSPSDSEECVKQLERSADAILVIDYDIGSEHINRILGDIKEEMTLFTRDILLIISGHNHQAIMTGLEYSVTRILTGELSKHTSSFEIKALIADYLAVSASKSSLREVMDLRKKGDWSEATNLLESMNRASPDDGLIAFEYVENLIHQGDWGDALSYIHPFAESDTPNIRALHLMARCLMSKGDHEGAISLLTRANICNPHNVERLIDLGASYIAVKKYEEATEVFGQAISIDPDNTKAKKGMGQSMLLDGAINEALPLLKSISEPRELAAVFNTSAILCARSGQVAHGLSLYKLGITVLAKEKTVAARLIFNMGITYKKQDEMERAYFCFSKAFELDEHFNRANQHLSHVVRLMKEAGIEPPSYPLSSKSEEGSDNPFDMPDSPDEKNSVNSIKLVGDPVENGDIPDDDLENITAAA